MKNFNFLWLKNNTIKKLINALNYENHQFKFVGGCIRDSLYQNYINNTIKSNIKQINNTPTLENINLNIENIDFDIASKFTPVENSHYLKKNNIKIIPTGEKYGTITAIIDNIPFQITTLRQDISCDGRHAEVSFSNNFLEDAKRRDFTFNALYLDPKNNSLSDYFNGFDDLKNGNVNFIGDIYSRIQEDYLRILRYFRFYAKYGKVHPSIELLEIIKYNANNMQKLSIERISGEFYKLMQNENPQPALKLMLQTDIINEIMNPSVEGICNFDNLIELENITKIYSLNTRLCLILNNLENNKIILKKADLKSIKNILQLKEFLQKYTVLEFNEVCELLSHYNYSEVIASLILIASNYSNVKYHYLTIIERLEKKSKKTFPITGHDLIKLGINDGVEIKETLQKLKKLYWQSSINNKDIEDKNYYLKHLPSILNKK